VNKVYGRYKYTKLDYTCIINRNSNLFHNTQFNKFNYIYPYTLLFIKFY